jgi:hypothetical protein
MAWQRAGVGSWAELRIGSGFHALPYSDSTTKGPHVNPSPVIVRLAVQLSGHLEGDPKHLDNEEGDTNQG